MSTNTGTGVSAVKSVSSYWNPLKPLGGETPSFWVKENSRSGLTLTDSVNSPANDVSILLPHLYLKDSKYGYINDNGALDIAQTGDFTMCGWVNSKMPKTSYVYFMGKLVPGSVNGRFGFWGLLTSGYFSCYAQSSGGFVQIDSTIDATSAGWTFLLMDVNKTTSKLRFFINNVQIGADTAFTGSFSALANYYRFYLNANNTVGTGAAVNISACELASVRIFNNLLTPTERTTLYNQGHVAGARAFWPLNNEYLYDSSNNGYDLTASSALTTNVKYSTIGSRQSIDVGYSRHIQYPNKEIQVPYTGVSTPCTKTISGYTKDSDIPGNTLNHNGASSFLMPVAGTMDRSSTTTCPRIARELNNPFQYDVDYKTGLHALEATNRNIATLFWNDYRGKDFIKRNGRVITDWVHYDTNKTGTDYDKAIQWTAENMNFAFGSGRFVSTGIYHPYSTTDSIRIGASLLKEGPYPPLAHATLDYPGRPPFTHIGNSNMIALNTNKCNGTVTPIKGETNFLLIHETGQIPDTWNGLHLWKSHNGLDWTYGLKMPKCGNDIVYMESWVVENDDPTDYHNIHYIGFIPGFRKIYESHPLNAEFSQWSEFVCIFTITDITVQPFNAIIWYMGGEWHMFYSAKIEPPGTHYMHHAKCTHDPFAAEGVNDWADFQTGDWSGLGTCESYTLINTGGTNWILYFYAISANVYKYSLSTDDCATWSAAVAIDTFNNPVQQAVYVNKLL